MSELEFEKICKDPYSCGLGDLKPKDLKLHDWLCDLAESRGHSENEVCTISYGIWATLNMIRKIEIAKGESGD